MEYVSYKPFGAKGDGITNDAAAIAAAHAYANEHGLPVKSEENTLFYISDVKAPIIIRTDTDWVGTSFLIDDTLVPYETRGDHIFLVQPDKEPYHIDPITPPVKFQKKLDVTLPEPSILILENDTVRRYIRKGGDANDGTPQTEPIVVDCDGTVDMAAPIIWDYSAVTDVTVIPMDQKTLTLRGGTFTTRTASVIEDRKYYGRGIEITRSNVVVDGLKHYIDNEGVRGAPYAGILHMERCANITVRNCLFTPHIYFRFILPNGDPYGQGTYDITPAWVVNLTFEHCRQTIDILDTRCWGVMGSNFCKNITLNDCIFSRFDAHQGVANVTIKDCCLGHQGLAAIGTGTIYIENTTVYGHNLISLRFDYGSHWNGNAVIKNCKWIPLDGKPIPYMSAIIGGHNTEDHDFGYETYMPHTIEIDGLFVDDSFATKDGGVVLFANMNPNHISEEYEATLSSNGYPYHQTETVKVKNLTLASGKECPISTNPFMFRNTVVIKED